MADANNTTAVRMKRLAFEAYMAANSPADLDLDNCSNYDTKCCLDQPGVTPCPSCAAYERLVQEFDAIGVG